MDVWVDSHGVVYQYQEMTTTHLINTINYLRRKESWGSHEQLRNMERELRERQGDR